MYIVFCFSNIFLRYITNNIIRANSLLFIACFVDFLIESSINNDMFHFLKPGTDTSVLFYQTVR